MGRHTTDKPRPLKIILSPRDEAFTVISQFNNFKKSGADFRGKTLFIVRDKAQMEQGLLREAHSDLDFRR